MPKKKTRNTYGEGSIFYSNVKKKWMAQIYVGKDENGKRIRKSVTGDTKEEVREKLNEIKFDMHAGKFVTANGITFAQLMKLTLDEKLALNEFSDPTYKRYIETLKTCKQINDIPIQKIDSVIITQFLISITDYAPSTIKKIYTMLNQCFNEAMKRKIIIENPMANIKKPKSKKKPRKIRALTIDEQRKLISILKSEGNLYSQQLLIAMYTGMRMGEINALTIDDINMNFNFINIDKTVTRDIDGKAIVGDTTKTETGERTIPLNDLVKPIFEEIIKYYEPTEDRLLFHTLKGGVIATGLVNKEFQRIMYKHRIQDESVKGDITSHSLRHTYATRCIESGMPPKVLQKLLGHKDITITLDTYSDVFENFQSENVEKSVNYMKNIGLEIYA